MNVKYYEFLTPSTFSDVVADIKNKQLEGLELIKESKEGVTITDGKITFILIDKSFQRAETNTGFGIIPEVHNEDFLLIEVNQDDDPNNTFAIIEAYYSSQIAFLG